MTQTGSFIPTAGSNQSPAVDASTPERVAEHLLEEIRRGNGYAKGKKRRFRRNASFIKVASLFLSAASTVILGLQDLDFWASLAFSLVAVTTVLSAVEPFFNWRSRWILMEEMQYRFYRLEDDLAYYIEKTPSEAITQEEVDRYFATYQELWHDVSRRWLEQRGIEKPRPKSVA